MKQKKTIPKIFFAKAFPGLFYFFLFIIRISSSSAQTIYPVSSEADLTLYMDYIDCSTLATVTHTGPTPAHGDIIQVNGDLNLDVLGVPVCFIVPEGVILEGNYDLMSEQTPSGLLTSPIGTLIKSTKRTPWLNSTTGGWGEEHLLYLFAMEPGVAGFPTVIRNIRLQGASSEWQDDNDGDIAESSLPVSDHFHKLCGGIVLKNNTPGGIDKHYSVSHCEIFSFSRAGIFCEAGTSDMTIDHCFFHHVGGSQNGNPFRRNVGIGYGNWIQTVQGGKITLENNIYGESKEAIDAQSAPGELNINDCTFNNLGINKHSGESIYNHPGNADDGCDFFNRRDEQCVGANAAYKINDCAGGDISLDHNIFHTSNGATSFPYPYFDRLKPESRSFTQLEQLSNNYTTLCTNGTNYFRPGNNQYDYDGVNPNDLDDGGWSNIPVGFSFTFFNNAYSNCQISTNGYIAFNRPASELFAPPCTAIADIAAPNNYVAMCWADLDYTPTGSGAIRFWTSGTAPSRIFVVEYENALFKQNTNTHVTGQIILYETGGVEMRILSMDNTSNAAPKVMGTENETGSYGQTLLTFNQNGWSSLTFPATWYFSPAKVYDVSITNNTYTIPHDEPEVAGECSPADGDPNNPMHGYATIADNYIEDCPWENDANITTSGNSFSYRPGTAVSNTSSPQPPEVILDLKDPNGNSLPETANFSVTPYHSRVQYLDPATMGTDIQISTKPGAFGSDNLAYIIRTNPDNANSATGVDIKHIANNYFNDDVKTTTPATGEVLTPFSSAYQDQNANPLYGLFGIDVLAVDPTAGNNDQNYYASRWQHIPLIVTPPASEEQHLIFNIKDSYHEFHNFTVCNCTQATPTHVVKEVRLNYDANFPAIKNVIWSEDIAEGGDGWERVDIPLTGNFMYNGGPILAALRTDGRPNVISFDIAIEDGENVSVLDVKGVSVWVDDIYIKKNGSTNGENLIVDGDVESCNDIGHTDGCSWYIPTTKFELYSCTESSPPLSGNATEERFYPVITSPVYPNSATSTNKYYAWAGTSTREKKSGEHALAMTLDRIPDMCDGNSVAFYHDQVGVNDGSPLTWVATNIDFTDLLSCQDYDPGSTNLLGFLDFPENGGNATPGTYCNERYYLDHNITVAQNTTVKLNGCKIAIAPGVSITVQNGATLELGLFNDATCSCGTCSTVVTHLFACSHMWQGITLESGANFAVSGSAANAPALYSRIEDAVNAISCDQQNGNNPPKIYFRYVSFDQNYIDIALKNGNFPFGTNAGHTFIAAVDFNCTNGFISRHTSAGDDYFGTPAFAHIMLDNVSATNNIIQIGESFNSAYLNRFSNSRYGIYSINSSLKVLNAECKGLSADGAGIYAESDDDHNHANILQVIEDNSRKNKFSNWPVAINTVGMGVTEVNGNTLENNMMGLVSYRGYKTVIENNTINTFHTGIAIYDAADVAMETIDLPVINTVTGNTFNEGLPYDANNYGRDAIDIENSVFSSINLTVQNNKAYNTVNGIHLRGISGGMVNSTDGTIENGNMVRYSLPPTDIPNNYQHGIWLDNCGKVNIANNAVEWVDANSSAPDGTNLENMKGICLEASISCDITENVVANIEAGINVKEDCSGSNLFCNTMAGCWHGVYFDPNGISNKLTDQGDIQGQEAWKNKWVGNVDIDRVGGSAPASQFFWLYTTTDTDYEPITQLGNISVQTCANETQSCEPPDINNNHQRAQAFGGAVGDSTVDDPDSLYFKYNSKEVFYKAAKEDNSILALGTTEDVVYQQVFDSLSETNIGKYDAVKEHLRNGEHLLAQQSLATITDDNTKEENVKYISSLVAIEYSPYLDADSDTVAAVSVIAHQHPFYGGEAVYMARALLHLNVHDVLPPMRKAHNQQLVDRKKSVQGLLRPNPATNEVNFTYPHSEYGKSAILIYDMYGNKIVEYELNDKTIHFTTANYKQGIYFIHVLVNGIEKESHKLVIIR